MNKLQGFSLFIFKIESQVALYIKAFELQFLSGRSTPIAEFNEASEVNSVVIEELHF